MSYESGSALLELGRRGLCVVGVRGRDAENPVECVVCLDAIREGEPVKRLPCGHVSHSSCIDPWLMEEKAVCPTCRKGVFDDDESVGGVWRGER